MFSRFSIVLVGSFLLLLSVDYVESMDKWEISKLTNQLFQAIEVKNIEKTKENFDELKTISTQEPSKNGYSPLGRSVVLDFAPGVKFFLDNEANINVGNLPGTEKNLIQYVVSQSSSKIKQLFNDYIIQKLFSHLETCDITKLKSFAYFAREMGIDFNKLDYKSENIIFPIILCKDSSSLIESLIQYGWDNYKAVDKHGRTVLQVVFEPRIIPLNNIFEKEIEKKLLNNINNPESVIQVIVDSKLNNSTLVTLFNQILQTISFKSLGPSNLPITDEQFLRILRNLYYKHYISGLKMAEPILIRAILDSQVELSEELLTKLGANANGTDSTGEPLIFLALKTQNPKLVKLLINTGASLTVRGLRNLFPMQVAKAMANEKIIKVIHYYLNLKLEKAILRGDLDEIRKLISAGANVDAKTDNGMPFISFAIEQDRLEIVKELIGKRANIFEKDSNGKTAIDYANKFGNNTIKNLIKDQLSQRLIAAINENDVARIQNLIKFEVDVNNPYSDTTPLILAIRKSPDLVKLLLDMKANPNIDDAAGRSPLMAAAMLGNLDIIKLLILKEANPRYINKHGDNIILLAPLFLKNVNEVINYFVNTQGLDINSVSAGGRTALMNASEIDKVQVVKALIDNKANLNLQDKSGRTALYLATMREHADIVELLVAGGADIHIANNNKQTPLELAEEVIQGNIGDERKEKLRKIIEILRSQTKLVSELDKNKNSLMTLTMTLTSLANV